jgi:hypothetical protein
MYRFRIVPVDGSAETETSGVDGSSALNVLSQIECVEADVLRDGTYVFSVHKGGKAAFWHIFQRDAACDADDAEYSVAV